MPDESQDAERAMTLEERLANFAARCLNMLEALPRNGIGVANFRDQLARSATSVAANYAEACAPESRRDFASKMAKALKEAKESRMWLFIISRRGFFAESRTKPLLDEVNSIIRILGKSVSTTRSRLNEQKEAMHPKIDGNDEQQCTMMHNSPATNRSRPNGHPCVIGRATPA